MVLLEKGQEDRRGRRSTKNSVTSRICAFYCDDFRERNQREKNKYHRQGMTYI